MYKVNCTFKMLKEIYKKMQKKLRDLKYKLNIINFLMINR